MSLPLRNIAAVRPLTKKQRVLDFAASRGWTRIGELEWNALRAELPDVSEAVIRQAGLEIDAPWCGIRQHTFEELAQSLRDLSICYEARPELRQYCRAQVIAAKDRAKFLWQKRNIDEQVRQRKATMTEWMLIWLSDPAIFPAWLDALKVTGGPQPSSDLQSPPDNERLPTP